MGTHRVVSTSLIRNYYRAFTKNLEYNSATVDIFRRVLTPTSNGIDIGAYKGKFLRKLVQLAPLGQHFAFEPLPESFTKLKRRFQGCDQVRLFDVALGDTRGDSPFQRAKRYPSYSGFRPHYYPGKTELEELTVKVARLDDVIPAGTPIHLMKIDVEGAELSVFRGAERLIRTFGPCIIFEHGAGGARYYGVEPGEVFDLLGGWGMTISLLRDFLASRPPLSREAFRKHYADCSHFYFVASPLLSRRPLA